MNYPAWLIPGLLALAVVFLAVPLAAPGRWRTPRGWAVAALVLAAVAFVLILLAAAA
jgi:hypothetical protein